VYPLVVETVPSAYITTRKRGGNLRYVVRFRLGGRAWPLVHGGSFATMREARIRRNFIAGELAAGRNPAEALRALTEQATRRTLTFRRWTARFIDSRLDVDERTKKNYRSALRKAGETFGERDPETITVDEVATWVAELAEKHKPGTVQLYLIAMRLLLDFASVDPNPARDPRVKLPKRVREEPAPPPAEHFTAILAALPVRFRLLFVVIEQGALRLGEAVGLRWADVDAAGLRLRLPRSATKRDAARWVYLPEWLMDAIEATCPLEDRTPERKVFQGLSEGAAYGAMTRACRNAKIAHYHPHDLRHRRITIWHQSGVPARELAERAGHARPSMSLDVYSHVMPADEVAPERLLALIGERDGSPR
jgi:integrase